MRNASQAPLLDPQTIVVSHANENVDCAAFARHRRAQGFENRIPFPSMFEYCVTVLRLSEHAAYDRIMAARAARRFPVILDRLADGSFTLTTVRLLAPHLTDANQEALLMEARHCRKRDVEHIIARLHPQPDVPSSVRRLPTPAATPPATAPTVASAPPNKPQAPATPAPESLQVARTDAAAPASPASPGRPAVVAPIAPARYKVSFTVGAETYAKLRQVQDLLRHVVPDGDPAEIYDRALTALLTQLLKAKDPEMVRTAVNTRPQQQGRASSRSRRIPAAVQRTVWQRDGGRCTFVSRSGRRCAARGWLEFHHVVPFAMGGEASVDNICLRCRAHNAYQAQCDFGGSGAMHVREVAPSYGAVPVQLVPARVRRYSCATRASALLKRRCRVDARGAPGGKPTTDCPDECQQEGCAGKRQRGVRFDTVEQCLDEARGP